jgi:triphosphatase
MKADGQEIELKFRTTPAGLRAASDSPLIASAEPQGRSKTLSSIYFDTQDLALSKRKISLRIRRCGRSPLVMTLKRGPGKPLGPFSREEIEIEVETATPRIDLFEPEIAQYLSRILDRRPLEPQFETRVRRKTRIVRINGSSIEAAFDHGFALVQQRRLKINELELELKSGSPIDLYSLGTDLAAALPLRLEVASKAQAAFAFARSETPAPIKAAPIRFAGDAALDDAFAAILFNALEHFLRNWSALRDGRHPESIHQMRVALRRMRSALGIVKVLAPNQEVETLRARARDIAAALGPARQCDVLQELIETGPKTRAGAEGDFSGLEAILKKRSSQAYAQAIALIDAPATTIFGIEAQSCIARRAWRQGAAEEALAALDRPGKAFAASTLDRLHRRVRKKGANLAELPDAERHQVRVALKKLRYAAEFFGPYFRDERSIKEFERAAAELQDVLGAHNDVAEASSFLDALEPEAARRNARAAGLMIGWYARDEAFEVRRLAKAWKAFRHAGQFWR